MSSLKGYNGKHIGFDFPGADVAIIRDADISHLTNYDNKAALNNELDNALFLYYNNRIESMRCKGFR